MPLEPPMVGVLKILAVHILVGEREQSSVLFAASTESY